MNRLEKLRTMMTYTGCGDNVRDTAYVAEILNAVPDLIELADATEELLRVSSVLLDLEDDAFYGLDRVRSAWETANEAMRELKRRKSYAVHTA